MVYGDITIKDLLNMLENNKDKRLQIDVASTSFEKADIYNIWDLEYFDDGWIGIANTYINTNDIYNIEKIKDNRYQIYFNNKEEEIQIAWY